MAEELRVFPFVAVVERDAAGAWIATVPALRGVHTHARSLSSLRRYLQDAIALWLEVECIDAGDEDPRVDRDSIAVELQLALPVGVRRTTDIARRRRQSARVAEAEAAAATKKAARALSDAGLSRRDAAELLGLSHQRIDQLLRSV